MNIPNQSLEAENPSMQYRDIGTDVKLKAKIKESSTKYEESPTPYYTMLLQDLQSVNWSLAFSGK